MKYYEFITNDQTRFNWLTIIDSKEPPYNTFRPEYTEFVCQKCKAINHDGVFAKGFRSDLRIRARGNFFTTSEGFICFDDKTRRIVELNDCKGIEFKSLANTNWSVIRATLRVKANPNAYEYSPQRCPLCSRPRHLTGAINFPSDITAPKATGSFFSPEFDRGGKMNRDRDLFVTEDIALRFKGEGLKGGYFRRLLTEDEEAQFREAERNKIEFKWPKGTKIYL